ncbi:MAG: right-handed parallel beta-helix repeat-containing protein [Methanomassiliicoccaceae archaeon]|nr:right-handed parallel beta-helix repeat-containing protein [Methanomassiliicoccaceae archaeon]
MRKHEIEGRRSVRTFIPVVFAAMFIAAAGISLTVDNDPQQSDDHTYLGDGMTFFIGDEGLYENLEGLMDHVKVLSDGDRIVLTSDVECFETFKINGKNITIDTRGFDLKFTIGQYTYAIDVRDGSLDIIGGGVIKSNKEGIRANGVADVIINSNLDCTMDAIHTRDSASVIINGNVTSFSGDGIYATNLSNVAINGSVTFDGIVGIYARDLATISVNGDITILFAMTGVYAGDSATVSIDGSLTARIAELGAGIYAHYGGKITIDGNLTIDAHNAYGVSLYEGGEVTIDGELSVGGDGHHPINMQYLDEGWGVYITTLGFEDHTEITTKEGYLTYTDGVSTLWIKEEEEPYDGGSDGGDDGGSDGDPDDGSDGGSDGDPGEGSDRDPKEGPKKSSGAAPDMVSGGLFVASMTALAVMCVMVYFFGVRM